MKRRDFINWVGLGGIASFIQVAIATCTAKIKVQASSLSKDWQTVATTAELDKTNQLLVEKSPVGPVLVVRTSKSEKIIAVNPTCTHQGCQVAWKAEDKKFVCPCHEAEFSTDGKVQKGPAKKPLTNYVAKIAGNSVLVKQI